MLNSEIFQKNLKIILEDSLILGKECRLLITPFMKKTGKHKTFCLMFFTINASKLNLNVKQHI